MKLLFNSSPLYLLASNEKELQDWKIAFELVGASVRPREWKRNTKKKIFTTCKIITFLYTSNERKSL